MILLNPALTAIYMYIFFVYILYIYNLGLVELRCKKMTIEQKCEKVTLKQKCRKTCYITLWRVTSIIKRPKKGLGRHVFLIEAKTTYYKRR